MHVRGKIYHHSKFEFHNGEVGKKYVILLNTPTKKQPYLVVKTTSQKKDKPSTPCCIEARGLFFIPGGKTFFPEDTWVQLYDLYPLTPNSVSKSKEVQIVGDLDENLIAEIVDCLFRTREADILDEHKTLLRPPIRQALQKLKDMFPKKH